jgi:hypothetical protein
MAGLKKQQKKKLDRQSMTTHAVGWECGSFVLEKIIK